MQLQGGGGSRRGASGTDDNAADVRARARVVELIQTTPPEGSESRAVGCASRRPLSGPGSARGPRGACRGRGRRRTSRCRRRRRAARRSGPR
ncbi:hypothetical protein D0Z67_14155 [Streptomyces seoulensis]|uniref:Uncharacterized protein n=1 Tax=Streptomyces seoulensis TaxID=73044 RepID=A0A4P6TUU4_STRSO|nr:hypothetical protein D0Z67_14155 [Streptomyces seoulensis]